MTPPAFWTDPDSRAARLLSPVGWLYQTATAWRMAHAQPWHAPIPVACIGNLTAGGAGKTPVVRDLAQRLDGRGYRPAVLSRGYGGTERGPLRVDPAIHSADTVGDEPLLLATRTPCWVAADRAAGARAIVAGGAGVIVMDDGLQNPALAQDLRIVVVDGAQGFGNGFGIPAGPLRERVAAGLARAHAAVMMGDDERGLLPMLESRLPVLRGSLAPVDPDGLAGCRVLAFAGIGRPEKFRATLLEARADIAGFRPFPDHHAYALAELDMLAAEAERLGAILVTTEKDWMRLDSRWRARVRALEVAIVWRDRAVTDRLLDGLCRHV
jgi:tetraacyldisaccharide 4'-kinase